MSKRKREEIEDLETSTSEAEQAPEQEVVSKPKIPFSHWFDKQLKANRVRHYQDEALLVFFKKQGLKSLEDEEKYDKALQRF